MRSSVLIGPHLHAFLSPGHRKQKAGEKSTRFGFGNTELWPLGTTLNLPAQGEKRMASALVDVVSIA